ncbi:MAG: hypothetical protein AB7P40_00955 [Chloroflexota bacterium]
MPLRQSRRSRWPNPRWRRLPAIILAAMLAAGVLLGPHGRPQTTYAQSSAGDAYAWAIGGAGADEARQVAFDGEGNLYVTGVFSAEADVSPGQETTILTSAGDTDIFLAKYDPLGRVIWAWSLGGPGADRATQVAVDPLGNVYLAGGFTGAVDFAPGEPEAIVQAVGARTGFLAKYDPSGVMTWVSPLAVSGDDEVMSMALDGIGNVVAAGLSGMSAQPGEPVGNQQGDAFVMRLDGNGSLVWSAILPTRSVGHGPVAVAVSPAGDVYLAVSYTGTVRVALGANVIDATSAGEADVLVMKLTPVGGLVWFRSIGGPGADAPGMGGLTLDPDGNVLLTGSFGGSVDVAGDGAFVLDGQGQDDLFLISLDGDGAVRWAASIGGPGQDAGQRVVTDAARYVYVAGWFTGDPTTAPAADGRLLGGRGQGGATDALLAKYTPDGQLAWARGFGGRGAGPEQSSLATAALVDARGDVVLAGRFFGTDVDFDPDGGVAILSSAGQSDAFVVRLGPSGSLVPR